MRSACVFYFKLLHILILFDQKTSTIGLKEVQRSILNETKKYLQNKFSSKDNNGKQNVLLISFDGFRWDYFNLVDTPILNSFKRLGVHAKYVKNVIPTSTFPNHVTLATGLYPESHGFVSNEFYDPVFKSNFNMTVTNPKWWWNSRVEPIWYTNEKYGGVSGVCYWPGFNIKGYRPHFYADKEQRYAIPYHSEENLMPYKERVDNVINWLQDGKPPNFLMLYFGQLDEVSHKHGYGSKESLREVSKLDNITGYLLDRLSAHNLLDKWNIIITGDHGMTNVSLSRVVDLSDYLNNSDYTIIGDGGVIFIWPHEGKMQQIFNKLKNAHPHMKVYFKKTFPNHFHYRNNRRVSPIVLVLDEGWMLNMPRHPFNAKTHSRATHGYMNTLPSMWPLFLARGPAFKKGYFSAPFQLVDIYPLICKILGIKAQPNNGSLSSVRPLLSEQEAVQVFLFSPVLVGILVAFLFFLFGIFIFAIVMCISNKRMKKSRRRPMNAKVVMSELKQENYTLLGDDNDDSSENDLS